MLLNTLHILIFTLILISCSTAPDSPDKVTVDVCIYGGSEASFTAAIQAAKQGRSVALIAPYGHIGGFAIEGLSRSDVGDGHVNNKRFVSGLPLEFYNRVRKHYNHDQELGTFGWEPHVGEKLILDWLGEYPLITIFRNERLREGNNGILKKGTEIEQILMESGKRFEADIFIDATIEGDLMAFSGVSYTFGREGNAKYDETLNGVYPEQTYRQFEVAVDPYKLYGDPESGLISTVLDVPIGEEGEASPYIMGYCFRICLTDVIDNLVPVVKPQNYNPEDYEIYRRYFAAGGSNPFLSEGPGIRINVPERKTDMGSWHDLSANLYGMNVDYPDAGYKKRQEIYEYHRNFTQGLIWFLKHDPAVPENIRERWKPWGLPSDEFIDNGNWPRRMYVRSARRMVSDYVITEHNGRQGSVQPFDIIGVTYWPFDMHAAKRIVRDGHAWNEGFVFDKNTRPFGISYRALVPKRDECTNLIVAACPSSSYVAYGAVRLIWMFMTLGQAAGAGASIAAGEDLPVQDVNYEELKKQLLENGQVLDPFLQEDIQ